MVRMLLKMDAQGHSGRKAVVNMVDLVDFLGGGRGCGISKGITPHGHPHGEDIPVNIVGEQDV